MASEDICLQSCQPTPEARQRELLLLLYGKAVATNCNGLDASNTDVPEEGMEDRRKLFINMGIYVSVIVFLALAILFSFASVVFALTNILTNPIYMIFR